MFSDVGSSVSSAGKTGRTLSADTKQNVLLLLYVSVVNYGDINIVWKKKK